MDTVFRVLVVDDKIEVLDSMKDYIDSKLKIFDSKVTIELLLLHVDVLKENDKYKISEKTIQIFIFFFSKTI